MYLFIDNMIEGKNVVDNFKLCEVKNEDMINTWCELLCDSYKIRKNQKDGFKKKVICQVLNDDSDYKFYLGLINGKAVSTSAILRSEGDKEDFGMYFLSTIPKARNQGIGQKMVVETLKCAKENGFEFVVIQSQVKYKNLFEKLGFIHSHTINVE